MIYSALPWYIYLIAAFLSLLLFICFGKVLFRIYQTYITRRRRNIQYADNPVFEEDIIDEEVYKIPRGITFNNRYTMLKLFLKFRGVLETPLQRFKTLWAKIKWS